MNFPIDAFPTKCQEIINQTNRILQFPIDYIASAMLFTASVAIGNTRHIRLKNGLEQCAVMLMALVGKPGANKSSPLEFTLRPLLARNREYIYQDEQCNDNCTNEVDLDQILMTDYTFAALKDSLGGNFRGIGIYMDELPAWAKNLNRYGGGELEMFNSIWSQKSIIVNRKTSRPILVELPFVSVIGTIQPGSIDNVVTKTLRESGFTDRILFAMPLDTTKKPWNEDELPVELELCWDDAISKLLELDLDEGWPQFINLDAEAYQYTLKWQKRHTERTNKLQDEETMGLYSKMDIYFLRFSLVLQLLFYACGEGDCDFVSLTAVKGAEKLVEYFISRALHVDNLARRQNPLDKLPRNKLEFYKCLPEVFSRSKAMEMGTDMSESTIDRFIRNRAFFTKLAQNLYEKNIPT